MAQRFANWLRVLFLVGFLASAVAFNATKPRVMILHSYDPDYSWTRDVDVGIRKLADEWSDYSVIWHYMDTKRHSDRAWLERAGKTARQAVERIDPDVLILVDDLAQDLVGRYYVNHPHIQLVFSGVNGHIEPYGYDGAVNVTGVFERKPLRAVKELVQALEAAKEKPNPSPRLVYLIDPSPSMQRDRNFVEAFDWAPLEYAGSLQAESFEHWQQLVEAAAKEGDYLLLANYRKLPRTAGATGFVSAKEVMGWTEVHSSIPVIGVNVFNVEDGGALAVGASPFEQGSEAARMAETILEQGQRANRLPTLINNQYVVALHRQALEQRGLHLPQVYETFARTTATYIEQ